MYLYITIPLGLALGFIVAGIFVDKGWWPFN